VYAAHDPASFFCGEDVGHDSISAGESGRTSC
jgi:hypothetical protein